MSHLPWHAIDLLHIKALIIFRTHIKIQITALSNSMTILISYSYYLSVLYLFSAMYHFYFSLFKTLSHVQECLKQRKIYFLKFFEHTQLQSAIRFLCRVLSVCRLSASNRFFSAEHKINLRSIFHGEVCKISLYLQLSSSLPGLNLNGNHVSTTRIHY